MMTLLLTLHQWMRWIVLFAGALALIRLFAGLRSKQRFRNTERNLIAFFLRTLELQTVLGLVLLVWAIVVGNPRPILHGVHTLLGVIAVAGLHWARRAEARWPGKRKFRNSLIAVAAALALILAGMFLVLSNSGGMISLEETFEGHTDAVRSVAFSPDGGMLASGSFDGTIKLWDVAAGQLVNTLEGHEEAVRGVAFSPDGTRLASASFDQIVKVWTLPGGELLHSFHAHAASINKILFTPGRDNTIATASLDNSIRIWDIETGEMVDELADGHEDGILSIAYSPDGALLASGGVDHLIRMHDVDGNLLAFMGSHENYVYDLAFSPAGNILASASIDTNIKLWDAQSGEEIKLLDDHQGAVQTLAFSPGGDLLASGASNGVIMLWNPEQNAPMTKLDAHERGVLSLAFSPDGDWIASSSADRTVRLWKVKR